MRFPRKLLAALPLLFLLYFYGLNDVGMIGPDEPRYAAIGREMALSGDWITPRLWGKPWFEKPALTYWLTAIGFRLGLGPELAPRVPIAMLSVWFLLFYFFRMRREFGERAALFSSAILATTGGWLAFSHVAVTDLPLATTFSASMLLALPWVRSGGRRGLSIGGALLGLAVLAKGLVALVLALPLFWVGRRRWKDLLLYLLAAAVTALPWYLLCYARNGWTFVEVLIIEHHLGRFLRPDLSHVQPWWFYLPVFAGLLFPWTPTLLCLRGVDWREPRKLLLIMTVVFGLVFFSASTNKLPGYVLPLLPSTAALIGIQMATTQTRFLLPACVLLLALLPVAATVLPEAVAAGLRRASIDNVWWSGTVMACAIAAGLIVMQRRRPEWQFPVAMLTATAAMLWFITVTFPELDQVASARQRWLVLAHEQSLQCFEGADRNLRYGLSYYAGRELPPCSESRRRNHDILDRDKGISR